MKPTQEQILSALNKLVRENKTELKAEKIELGSGDDIKKLYKSYLSLNKKYDSIYAPVSKVASEVNDWVKEMNKIKTKSESLYKETIKLMKELGIKAGDFPQIKDLNKILDDKIVLAHAKSSLKELKKF
tara:strand:+ start:350 stop:736 length:387 start_codon:yes stop_codon:yes gene_type:complete